MRVGLWIMAIFVALVPTVASAKRAPWVPVRDRQAVLESVLQRGERTGTLNAVQARRARTLYKDIARRELRYEASPPGLTLTEKGNLDFRFNGMIDALKAQIKKR